MYSVMYNVLLNPFPYTDTQRSSGGIRGALTVPKFRGYLDESDVFEEAVGTDTRVKQRRTADGTEDIVVSAVTAKYLPVSWRKTAAGPSEH